MITIRVYTFTSNNDNGVHTTVFASYESAVKAFFEQWKSYATEEQTTMTTAMLDAKQTGLAYGYMQESIAYNEDTYQIERHTLEVDFEEVADIDS